MNQKLSELKRRTKPKRHGIGKEFQKQLTIKIIREPGNEKSSEPLVRLGGKILPVLDANLSEGKQFELAHEQRQHKRNRIGQELQAQQQSDFERTRVMRSYWSHWYIWKVVLENMKNKCESLSWITARSVDRINWIMVGVCSLSMGDELGIFTCSITTSNEWDIQV